MSSGRKIGNLGRASLPTFGAAAILAALLVRGAVAQSSEQVLYSFCQHSACADGAQPRASLIMDAAGNLYGTTSGGGSGAQCNENLGCGTVFRLAPDGTETVLYSFCSQLNCTDGKLPLSDLIMDAAGNLYGTTGGGGAGDGVVFKLAPDGTQAVLYSFCLLPGCADGANPFAGLIMDAAGNLYGTTNVGGTNGFGVVFELAPDGTESVLHSFSFGDGANPEAGLTMDAAGNLYGTTSSGGAGPGCPIGVGCGVVFQLTPDGTYTILYNFCSQSGCADGAEPFAGLVLDAAGNLYGTTAGGGPGPSCAFGAFDSCGTVFGLAPDGTESVLYGFCQLSGCADGANPHAGLIIDAAGNLYGTTASGGTGGGFFETCDAQQCGTVFRLASDGTETVLYSFCQQIFCDDGARPFAGLVMDAAGNLYGTTIVGGTLGGTPTYGTVFEVTP